jgi:hypothetical protein
MKVAIQIAFVTIVQAAMLWLCIAGAQWGGLYGIVGGIIGSFVGFYDWRPQRDGRSRLLHAWVIGFGGMWIGLIIGGLLTGVMADG